VLLWVEQAGTLAEPRFLSLWLALFLIIFPHAFQEAILALRGLHLRNTHMNSLGKNLALNLLVHNNAVVAVVGDSFLNSSHALDITMSSFL
jgi:hypothetical protein